MSKAVKLALITPTVYLDKFASQGDIHLILSHLIGENTYTEYYRKQKKLKIMDNGLFENHVAEPTTVLLKKAEIVGADVIVAPDVLYDCDATLAELDKFQEAMAKSKKKYKVFGVPQGKNLDDYLRCHRGMYLRGVDFIGLSILAVPKAFKEITGTDDISLNRMVCMNYLEDQRMVFDGIKYHCLGLGSFAGEIAVMAQHKWVYSNDSCSFFQTANVRQLPYFGGYVVGGKPEAKLEFNMMLMDSGKEAVAQKNIETLKRYAQRA